MNQKGPLKALDFFMSLSAFLSIRFDSLVAIFALFSCSPESDDLQLLIVFLLFDDDLLGEGHKQPMARDGDDNLPNHEIDNFDFDFRFDRSSLSSRFDDGEAKSMEVNEDELILDFSLGTSFSVCAFGEKLLPSRENLDEIEPIFPESEKPQLVSEPNTPRGFFSKPEITLGSRLIPERVLFSSPEKAEPEDAFPRFFFSV